MLAIAMILGIELPKLVYHRNIDDVCILDNNHTKFGTWVSVKYMNTQRYAEVICYFYARTWLAINEYWVS